MSVISLQVVCSLTIPSISRGPSLLLSFIWVPRISSLTSKAPGGWIPLTFTYLAAHVATCFSARDSGTLFRLGWRIRRFQNSFGLMSLAGQRWAGQRRYQAPLFVFSPLRPDYHIRGEQRDTKQYSDTARNTQLRLCQAWLDLGLSWSNTPELLSYLLTWEHVNVKWSFTQHSIAIAHFDCIFIVCVCTCGYNMTIYTYMYGVCF